MRYYDYMVKEPESGKHVRGVITADDAESAAQSLKTMGITIMEVSPLHDFLNIRQTLYNIRYRIRKKDIKEFFEQLSFMLATNLQMYNALLILRDFSVNKKLRFLSKPIADGIRKGMALHEALEVSGFFHPATVMQIKSGEESGDVPNFLKRIALQYEREIEFTAKLKNAMIYPALVVVVMIVVLWVLMTMVVPSLAATLKSLGGELPLITKIVIAVSRFMSVSTPYLIVLLIGVAVWYNVMMKHEHFKYRVDSTKLKIPVIGGLITKLEVSRFCRNLSAMQTAGITLVRSLSVTKTAIKNTHIKIAVEKASKLVEVSGINLATALSKAGEFPEIMIQLIQIGVSAGQLSDVLEKIAYQYEKDIDNSIKRITSLIEPIMIIVVGILVGTVVISVFMPMFAVIDNLQ